MNETQLREEIYKTVDIITEKKLKKLEFDKTKQGRVLSVDDENCIVRIDGEDYTCKLRRGICVKPNDIVFVKIPQNSNVDRYVDAVLGGNEELPPVVQELLSTIQEMQNRIDYILSIIKGDNDNGNEES